MEAIDIEKQSMLLMVAEWVLNGSLAGLKTFIDDLFRFCVFPVDVVITKGFEMEFYIYPLGSTRP